MDNDQRIAEIEARCEAATPGPWYVPLYGSIVDTDEKHLLCMMGASVNEQVNADMRFIAASREDLPWAIEQIKALTAEVERLSSLAMMREGEIGDRDREIERLREAQRWIPVTERLPDAYQHDNGEPIEFNVMIDGAKVPTAISFNGAEWRDFFKDGGYGPAYAVTHWRPLPDRPEGESK